MNYRYLEAFIALSKTKNFSQAAAQMQIAQSALSRQIKLLEEDLGLQLFVRSSHKVMLTPEGEKLASESNDFDTWLRETFYNEKRVIRIGALQGVMLSWLEPRLLKIPQQMLPNLDLRVSTAFELIQGINKGIYDIIFTNEEIENDFVSSRKLYVEKFVLISSSKIDIKNISNQRWIYGDSGDYLMSVARKNRSQRFLRIEGHETLLRFVEAGLGVAIIPKNMLPEKFKGSVQDLPQLKSGFIYMSTLNYKRFPKHLDIFVKELLK